LGTWFVPPGRRLQGRKHWLAYGLRPTGSLTVNECARAVLLKEGRSLLAAGVVGVSGTFSAGDAVSLRAEDGHEFARGQVTCDWREAERVMGRHSDEIQALLGRHGVVEIIHRNNLVVLSGAVPAGNSAEAG
jgi:glutamate 5-kinase